MKKKRTRISMRRIQEYIGTYPVAKLTKREMRSVKEEIRLLDGGGFVLDGITVELQMKELKTLYKRC